MSENSQISPTSQEQSRKQSFENTLMSARRTMLFSEILKMALESFRAAKMRFALTALGMVIGTASVILVVTIGMTAKQYILTMLQQLETNSVEVEYEGGSTGGPDNVAINDYMNRDDIRVVAEQMPGVLYSSPILEMHERINFGGGLVKNTLILGVDPQYRFIRNLVVLDGRFLDVIDDNEHIKCAAVTEKFARERFGNPDRAVGQTFSVSGIPFTIIGVFREAVDDMGQSELADQTVLIPYSVGKYFSGTENVKMAYFSMRSMDEVPDASKEIVRILQSRHRPNSVYKAQTLTELLTTANKIANALTAVLVLVATVTLAVGGVGIMNIMLANVRARIREIGIRKAMGATYREIQLQFLAEAVLISLAGGIVGSFVGLAMPLSVRLFTSYSLPISPWSVVIALSVATIVGVIFGTVPATRAAQMNPIDSLKYE